MTRSGLFRALALGLLLALPAVAQQAERQKILEQVGPSVVALRTGQSYGSGMILDAQGTILTNAHVIISPLPMRVEAQFKENGTLRTAFFTKVVLIGVHPTRDLALVRIDPDEHKAKLEPMPIARGKVQTRDLVHAVGFPSSHGGQRKTCTTGDVTALDQFVDMPGYFEFSAEVHGGNSGGPICNPSGQAVGIVTCGKTNGEPVAWAIPLHDLRPDQFVPLDRRPKDPAKASQILRYAEEMLKKAKSGKRIHGMISGELFQLALLEDVSNPDIYYKIGMILRHFQDDTTAAAYLIRSIQLQPWNDSKQEVYNELGISLVRLRKTSDAVAIWNEGIAKFPGECGLIWDALAIFHYEEARFLDAACATRASLRAFGPRGEKMNEIYDQCRRRLDAEAVTRLTVYEKTLDAQVVESRKLADHARQNGKRFLTPACETMVKSFEGVQKEATDFNFSTLGKGPQAPKAATIPDGDLLPLFIRSRIAAAGEHLQSGKIAVAAEVLEDIIKTYPDHPDTETARELLALIRKKQK